MAKVVEKQKLKVPPNLSDYEAAYKKFRWEDYYGEFEWFGGNKFNAAHNAVDRHLKGPRKNKVALFWEGKSGERLRYTFEDLARLSNRFANLLKNLGVARGERVFFFLPRVPELYFGFLGTLKRGAIAGTLFSAFGPQALLDRLGSSGAKVLVTTPPLKKRVDKIRRRLPRLERLIVVDGEKRERLQRKRFGEDKNGRRLGSFPSGEVLDFYEELSRADENYQTARMRPSDPGFMLYTSGTTGKPKGVVHTHRALFQEHLTAKWVLDIHERDTYWCTADPGWVTGIAYEILGTWSNGAATLVYEGRFDPDRWYSLIEDYKVNVWYTAPTAIRMLAAAGVEKKYDLSSLRHLCSVGEPLNPEAVLWGLKALGLPFHDNYWQTETGGIVIANYPSLPIRPGSMGKPVPGVAAAIVDDQGRTLAAGEEGNLALRPGWPSMMKTIWRRPKKYQSYFTKGPDGVWYLTGDKASVDKDGYFWFIGRADDVIKTAGERVGPFEVESALVSHPLVVEAGVIGKPDPLRGEIIKAFVVLRQSQKLKVKSQKYKSKIKNDLTAYVKKCLAGHAYPREIEFVANLPKTRSGKIVRRLLKARELGLSVGDTSTLAKF